MVEDFDIGPLTWVKEEIDQALKSVVDTLNNVAANPNDLTQLKFAKTHLYQVSGALDMVGLEGCKRFCAEIESLTDKLEKQVIPCTADAIELIKQATTALSDYLLELLSGAPDQPLRMFPIFAQLQMLQGEAAEESELFFPDTSIRVPKDVETEELDEASLPAYLKSQRNTFLKSLLAWLRSTPEDRKSALQGMIEALNNVQKSQKQPVQKTLWWVAAGFAETLIDHQIAESRHVKFLCRRLDQQLKSLSQGTSRASGNVLRDALYYIAVCPPISDRVAKVKQVFELEDFLPAKTESNAVVGAMTSDQVKRLEELEALIDTIKEFWLLVSQGQYDVLPQVRDKFEEAIVVSQPMVVPYDLLSAILKYINAQDTQSDKFVHDAIIEVAAAITLLEDLLHAYMHPSADLMSRIQTEIDRLERLGQENQDQDISDSMLEVSLGQDVLQAVAQQIRESLKVVEQSLDTYFRNPSDQDVLLTVNKPLQQVSAAFDMLNMPVPMNIAVGSQKLVNVFTKQAPDQAQFELLAESLSTLALFVEDMPRVRQEDLETLALAEEKLQAQLATIDADLSAPTESSEIASSALEADTEASTEESFKESAHDDELLDIFLSEAEEVIASNAQHLQTLRVNATDSEALVTVRRGFHTLKGSGRAVGLAAMGEVAWAVEKLLNVILERHLAPNADVLSFVETTTADFAAWVAELREQGAVEVNPSSYQLQSTLLEKQLNKQKVKPVPEEVVIGGTHKISRALFNIFMAEAEQHMQTLRESVAEHHVGEERKPSEESRRAAHTLASNAGTAGFAAIINLGRALEYWLDAHSGTWTDEGLQLYGNVVASLGNMLNKAAQYRQPRQATALINALRATTFGYAGEESSANVQAKESSDLMEGDDSTDMAPALDATDIPMSADLSALEAEASLIAATAIEDAIPESITPPVIADVQALPIDDVPVLLESEAIDVIEPPAGPVSNTPVELSDASTATHEEPSANEAELTPQLADSLPKDLAEDNSEVDSDALVVTSDDQAATVLESDSEVGLDANQGFEIDEVGEELAPEELDAMTQANLVVQQAIVQTADDELLTLFIEEARELVPLAGNELRGWQVDPTEADHPDELQRALHTLKGSARVAGQSDLADAVHDMEDRVIRALKAKSEPIDFDRLFEGLDQIDNLLEEVIAKASGAVEAGEADDDEVKVVARRPIKAERALQYMRLRADVLDRLINEAGEISIARSRMEREMQGLKHFSLDLTESVSRLRNQLREMEIEAESQLQSRMAYLQETNETFDPLEFDRFTRLQELTRLMAESVNDVATIQHGLLANLDETDAALQQQNRMNRELQRSLMNVRMVPFSLMTERLQRIVRQTSRDLKKPVEMHIEGETVDIDRSVLDKIGAPLEHLLRNAVAHGIESPAQRKKAKKDAQGRIDVKIRRENDEIIISVNDDGAGVDLKKVKAKAIELGIFAKGQDVSQQALMQVIFESGFSTATDVTQISGRGVGLDSVRADITALGGRIDVSNAVGKGAVFNIYLPVTLSVAQVVMVRAGQRVFAVPSVMVEQVQKLKPEALASAYADGQFRWSDRQYPLHFLGKLIGDPTPPEAQAYAPLLLLRSGTYQVAVHVDEILNNQEAVMKPIGPQLARVPGMIGATVLGDGSIVLILNAVQLANREDLAVGSVKFTTVVPVMEEQEAPLVLVVDDSLTMRKVLGRLLEREGYRIEIAKDGMDALQVLQDVSPDIILTDIEMPRMDGFELVRNLRSDTRFDQTPIIVISSRTAEKHQSLAKELGVDYFLGKPVQDEVLSAQIQHFLKEGRPVLS